MADLHQTGRNLDSAVKVRNLSAVPERLDFIFSPLCWVESRTRSVGNLGNSPLHCCKGAGTLRIAKRTRLEHQGIEGITGRAD